MKPHEGEGAPAVAAGTPPTPKTQCQPGTTSQKPETYLHLSTATAKRNDVGSRGAAPHFPIRTSDAAAWAIVTLVVGTVLIAACVFLTLGWPA